MTKSDLVHDGIAFIAEDKRLSYQELRAEAKQLAAAIPRRSVVLFIATNSAESLVAYYGFLQGGIVPMMASSTITNVALAGLLDAYRPEYLWCPKDFLTDFPKDFSGDFPKDFDYHGGILLEHGDYLLQATGLQNPQPPHPDLALLLSTSGSTGSQRYVRLTLANIKANAASIAEYLAISPGQKAITTLPFSYSYGLSIINSHLLVGGTVLLCKYGLFDREFWDFFKLEQATSFGGVPYTYAMLKRLRFAQMELPSLRYITQAGGRLGAELHQEFADICAQKGIGFFAMYGQTEATARISYLPSQRALDKIGSIGIAIPGGQMSLIDGDGQPVNQANSSGELIYQGANVCMGYATNRADLSLADQFQGRLATGDLATYDDEGFFYIVGRLKRFLKIFGNRVNLDEVEAALLKQDIIAACAGTDDAMQIFVEKGDLEKVQALTAAITSLNISAFKVQSIAALPRNDAGKILYAALEELC